MDGGVEGSIEEGSRTEIVREIELVGWGKDNVGKERKY